LTPLVAPTNTTEWALAGKSAGTVNWYATLPLLSAVTAGSVCGVECSVTPTLSPAVKPATWSDTEVPGARLGFVPSALPEESVATTVPALGEADGLGLGVGLGLALGVGLGLALGVGDGLALGVGDGLGDGEALGDPVGSVLDPAGYTTCQVPAVGLRSTSAES
jgi:hypothetical protein